MLPIIPLLLTLIFGGVGGSTSLPYKWLKPDTAITLSKKASLFKKFKNHLSRRGATGSETRLYGILCSHGESRVSFYEDRLYPDIIIVMVNKYQGLTRGFPIIWYILTDDPVKFGGFRESTGKDRRRGYKPLEADIYTEDIGISLKFSGFLSMLMCVGMTRDGKYLMLATTEDSASCYNEIGTPNYVLDAQRIWSTMLNACASLGSGFFKDMLDTKYTLSASIISKNDRTIGCCVIREAIIPTCISYGVDTGKFLEYLTPNDRSAFLTKHGIWFPSFLRIPYGNLASFINEFNKCRDFMTIDMLDTICQTYNDCMASRYPHGTLGCNMNPFDMYRLILDGPPEGVFILTKDSTSYTTKVRFPAYVLRTKYISEWLQNKYFTLGDFLYECCTTDDGREYYYHLIEHIGRLRNTYESEHQASDVSAFISIAQIAVDTLVLPDVESNSEDESAPALASGCDGCELDCSCLGGDLPSLSNAMP